MKRIAVIGARGMLGTELCRQIGRMPEEPELLALDHPEIDITDPGSVIGCAGLAECNAMINCAAYTNVEKAEDEENLATRVNGDGVRNLAAFARDNDIHLTHISTDFVFDGVRDTPYPPDAETNPLCAYGRSKRAGEIALERIGGRTCLVRTAWLFGPAGPNFVETMLALAEKNGKLSVVCDKLGSPTMTVDLSRALIEIVRNETEGMHHFTNAGVASWHQFACEIVRQAGLAVPVEPITSDEADERFHLKARRPRYSALDCSSVIKAIGIERRGWEDALAEYLRIRT